MTTVWVTTVSRSSAPTVTSACSPTAPTWMSCAAVVRTFSTPRRLPMINADTVAPRSDLRRPVHPYLDRGRRRAADRSAAFPTARPRRGARRTKAPFVKRDGAPCEGGPVLLVSLQTPAVGAAVCHLAAGSRARRAERVVTLQRPSAPRAVRRRTAGAVLPISVPALVARAVLEVADDGGR